MKYDLVLSGLYFPIAVREKENDYEMFSKSTFVAFGGGDAAFVLHEAPAARRAR